MSPFDRSFCRFPTLMVTPLAGFAAIFRLRTAHSKTVFRPERSLSFTVRAEIGLPLRGLMVARRWSLKRSTSSGVTLPASSCFRKAANAAIVFR